jgi:hypothetical protein
MGNPFEDLRQAVVVRPMNSPGPQGAAAPDMKIQYSYDGSLWHNDPVNTDRYLRFSTDNGVSWSDAIYFNNIYETLAWVDKARRWAINPENREVEPGKYSALHYASKAEIAAISAATDAAEAATELIEPSIEKARQWAENPENSPVIYPDQYSALHHASRAARSEFNAEAAALDAAASAAEAFGAAAPAWDSVTVYNYNDVVSFDNGHTYRCIGTNVVGIDHAPNINGVDNEEDWIRITVALNGFFELDEDGNYMPMIAPITSDIFMLDEYGDITYRDDGTIDEQFIDNEAKLRNMIPEYEDAPVSITIYTNIPITSGDLHIPSNVHLHFENNGRLSPDFGITVTLDCAIDAGPWQIFGGNGTFKGNPRVDAVYPEWWGAVGDGVADDTQALQAAADFCAGTTHELQYTLLFKTLKRKYRITSTLHIRSNADMSLSKVLCDASFSPAIKVGLDNTRAFRLSFKGPTLINMTKIRSADRWGPSTQISGWDLSAVPYPGAVGVQAINLYECYFENTSIEGFYVGLQVIASSVGNAYNTYYLGTLRNNKVNLRIDPTSGWCNENLFVGGQLSFVGETGDNTGTRQVEIAPPGPIRDTPNGNTFLNCSWEANFCEYKVFLRGYRNLFIGCRWEGSSTDVAFSGYARENIFIGGWGVHKIKNTRVILAGADVSNNVILDALSLFSTINPNSTDIPIAINFYNQSLSPSTDGILNLGDSSFRWDTIYAATGSINTSDEREKTKLVPLEEAERNVALKIKSMIGKFKFLDAIHKKGENNARIHFGATAQDIAKAFESEGLDPHKYGMFCYDEWDDDPGKGVKAGNRYGVRYDELLAFLIAAL